MASKITIPDLKRIRVTDPLFSHYAGMVAKKMIPVQWEILNGKQGQSRCFCIDNFRIAGGTLQGEHRGVVFGDTDAYKWLEAVAYCANNGETEYIPEADELIEIIGQAQQPDGYLNTYFTVKAPEERWTNLAECHELYCAGHMIEAGVAFFQATGKRRLLEVVCRLADHIDNVFGPGDNQLHGGPDGFDKRRWQIVNQNDRQVLFALTISLKSAARSRTFTISNMKSVAKPPTGIPTARPGW